MKESSIILVFGALILEILVFQRWHVDQNQNKNFDVLKELKQLILPLYSKDEKSVTLDLDPELEIDVAGVNDGFEVDADADENFGSYVKVEGCAEQSQDQSLAQDGGLR